MRDHFFTYAGLPTIERREARWAIEYLARSRNVVPLVLRRFDAEMYSSFCCRIANFEGRRCVCLALSGIHVIFELDDVKYQVVRRLRRRMYTWSR